MSKKEFFTISGLACALHTPETKKIWLSWDKNKSNHGRQCVIDFAIENGFMPSGNDVPIVAKDAFDYLIDTHPGAPKSWLIKKAIIDHS